MSHCLIMKNNKLTFALTLASGALFLCVLALFISWLDLRLQTGEDNPIYRFQTLIAGAAALLGAWLTVRTMRAQMDQVRTLEVQREAREYAAHLRDTAAKWRLSHSNMCTLATTYYDHRKSNPDKREAAPRIEDPPEIRLGRLPSGVRSEIAIALRMSADAVDMMKRVDSVYSAMNHNLSDTLKIWDATEVMSLYAIVVLGAVANAIERMGDMSGALKVTRADLQQAQIEMNPVVRIARHCGETKIVDAREDKIKKYAQLTFRSSAEFDEFLKTSSGKV